MLEFNPLHTMHVRMRTISPITLCWSTKQKYNSVKIWKIITGTVNKAVEKKKIWE